VAAIKEIPSDIASLGERVRFMPHDFLREDQPVKGADVYFFRWIFHNWSNKYSIRILRGLIPALKRGTEVVICDNVMPAPGEIRSRAQEVRLRSQDMCMAEIQNAHERELEDWKKLFEAADPRFNFVSATLPPGSNLWMIVVEWQGD